MVTGYCSLKSVFLMNAIEEQKGADYMNNEKDLGEKPDNSGQQPRYEHYQFHEEQGTVLKPSICISDGEFYGGQIPE